VKLFCVSRGVSSYGLATRCLIPVENAGEICDGCAEEAEILSKLDPEIE
jgi:hypothetical protein